ncbi:protoporphyrinogen oxidase HemJ [Rhodosalinus sp. FB01]|uniref:protoporphyrinogen oxidase HemJ n=1 Tax=Rhodosalinus sp. FB01 TaxID=3239194 RepID=UPI003525BB0B
MTDWLALIYPWTKSLHIMAVIAWMAGLFYLPRLYVYHAERATPGDALDPTLQIMESKLLRLIMNPSMIVTWVVGLLLLFTPQAGAHWTEIWVWTKGLAVIAMTWFHHWLGLRRKDFEGGRNALSGRRYRLMNEVPTLLMIVIVLSVVVKW